MKANTITPSGPTLPVSGTATTTGRAGSGRTARAPVHFLGQVALEVAVGRIDGHDHSVRPVANAEPDARAA